VGVTSHSSPSLNDYVLLDAKSGEVSVFSGFGFMWDRFLENIYYIRAKPHFGIGGVDKVYRNQEEVFFEAPESLRLLSSISLSGDESELFFFGQDADLNNTLFILSLTDRFATGFDWSWDTGKAVSSTSEEIRFESQYNIVTFNRLTGDATRKIR
jgi:hypothetical protein